MSRAPSAPKLASEPCGLFLGEHGPDSVGFPGQLGPRCPVGSEQRLTMAFLSLSFPISETTSTTPHQPRKSQSVSWSSHFSNSPPHAGAGLAPKEGERRGCSCSGAVFPGLGRLSYWSLRDLSPEASETLFMPLLRFPSLSHVMAGDPASFHVRTLPFHRASASLAGFLASTKK